MKKVDNNLHLNARTIGAEEVRMRISEEHHDKLFDLLQSPYSDPISSIVRETATNAWDAHVEANVNEPIVIIFDYSASEGYSITFRDDGIGMSPERMKNVYGSYLNSTKMNTNDQAGYFGIGSKSPLSYTNEYFITTRFDGFIYEYMIRKDDSGFPTMVTLNSGMPTDRQNGTEVKLFIDNTNDFSLFEKAIKTQLKYFNHLWLVDNTGIIKTKDINEFELLETDYFVIRKNKNGLDNIGELKELEIVIGEVRYPINWKTLNMIPISWTGNFSVAVKFQIGEIGVTLTREEIKYVGNTKELVKDKIKATVEHLQKLVSASNSDFINIDYSEVKQYLCNVINSNNNLKTYKEYYYNSFNLVDNFSIEIVRKTSTNRFSDVNNIAQNLLILNDKKINDAKIDNVEIFNFPKTFQSLFNRIYHNILFEDENKYLSFHSNSFREVSFRTLKFDSVIPGFYKNSYAFKPENSSNVILVITDLDLNNKGLIKILVNDLNTVDLNIIVSTKEYFEECIAKSIKTILKTDDEIFINKLKTYILFYYKKLENNYNIIENYFKTNAAYLIYNLSKVKFENDIFVEGTLKYNYASNLHPNQKKPDFIAYYQKDLISLTKLKKYSEKYSIIPIFYDKSNDYILLNFIENMSHYVINQKFLFISCSQKYLKIASEYFYTYKVLCLEEYEYLPVLNNYYLSLFLSHIYKEKNYHKVNSFSLEVSNDLLIPKKLSIGLNHINPKFEDLNNLKKISKIHYDLAINIINNFKLVDKWLKLLWDYNIDLNFENLYLVIKSSKNYELFKILPKLKIKYFRRNSLIKKASSDLTPNKTSK